MLLNRWSLLPASSSCRYSFSSSAQTYSSLWTSSVASVNSSRSVPLHYPHTVCLSIICLRRFAQHVRASAWIEDDVPEYLPVPGGPTWLSQSIEESVRYGLHEQEAHREWLYTVTAAEGGNVRLGPNHRYAIPSFAHQHHCLRALRTLLDEDDMPSGYVLNHAEHCLSVLRQHTLCAADARLERGDTFSRNFTAQRVFAERKCMNMEPYYETLRSLRTEWVGFRSMNMNMTL